MVLLFLSWAICFSFFLYYLPLFRRCKLCSEILTFRQPVLESHLSLVHGTSFSKYASIYLQNNTTIPSMSETVENGLHVQDEMKCDLKKANLRMRALDVKEEFAAEQECQGPGYRCPIQNCAYRTDMEVC